MTRQYDISEISKMLADRVESVCQWLLPAGHKEGAEWRAGDAYGAAGNSLGVNLAGKAGVWRDFADDAKGGDLIDLISTVHGVGKAEAVKLAKEWLGIGDFRPTFENRHKVEYKKPERPQGMTAPGEEMLRWFEGRGISREVVKMCKIGQIVRNGQPVIVFPYMRDGNLVFLKFRPLHDKKGMWTSKDSEPCLFGWQVQPENARSLVIVEGELDAMAFVQAGIAALSVPRGGGDGEKQDGWIDSEWDKLQLFDTIYLALDMDEQGRSAAEHIARRLGQHRCYWVDFGKYKDANEALMAGVDLNDVIARTAHTVDPEELSPASAYWDEVFNYYANGPQRMGNPLPWDKTHGLVGLRDGETTIWAGINGHGKSQIVGHIMAHSLSMGNRWCVASMEFKPYKLLARLGRQICANNQPDGRDRQSLDAFCQGLWVFDVQGTAKSDRILEVFEYAYRRYGVTNFLIDSLAKCGFADDDYTSQKNFVDKLSDFARNNSVQVHLVCHSRKRSDENEVPDKFDIKGSGGITDMVDNVFIVWRNKPKEKKIQDSRSDVERKQAMLDGPDAILNCCKQREGEWEGYIQLWFDKASLQYLQSIDGHPVRYCA